MELQAGLESIEDSLNASVLSVKETLQLFQQELVGVKRFRLETRAKVDQAAGSSGEMEEADTDSILL